MSSLGADIRAGMKSVAGDWKKAKKNASDSNDRVHRSRLAYMRWSPPRKTLKAAAFKFMQQAYNKASSNGKYYANARQVMYAARPLIIGELGAEEWDNDNTPRYFNTLIKDYMEEVDDTLRVVWDARGHLREPHTNYKIGLGGAEVMEYKARPIPEVEEQETELFEVRIPTAGPTHRFGAVLFIEKEGFDEQLEDAGILEKWDIALMSTKGIPNGAACNVGAALNIPVLALHDFDLAGFKIVRTLRRGARLSHGIWNLIDIGLRLEDVQGLEPEPVVYKQREDPRLYLQSCGATPEECDFLVDDDGGLGDWSGQRVEINMLTTEELLAFLERKFIQHGVKKVVPDAETLAKAYRRAAYCHALEEAADKIEIDPDVPDDLAQQINDRLSETPARSWDEVVWDLAGE